MTIRSSLARHIPPSPTPPETLHALAAKAWHEQGIAVVRLDEAQDDIARRLLEQVATRKFGRRMRR